MPVLRGVQVPRVPWDRHIAMLDERWEKGQHCSILGNTGDGKSRLVKGIWTLWEDSPHALAVDIKGDDPEVKMGTPVRRVPGKNRRTLNRMASLKHEHKEHYRVVLPRIDYRETSRAERIKDARANLRDALETAYQQRDTVVYFDELFPVVDPQTLGMRTELNDLWQRGRYRDVTIIACTQWPRWIPSAFYDAPTYVYLSRFRDKRTRKRLQEIGGDTEEIETAMLGLQQYEFLFIADKGETMQVVKHGR